MKLYLVRHGETSWNIGRKVQGQTDIPLNETGVRQAEKVREELKNEVFDICYCSPLMRARRTAEIATDGRLEIVIDENLKERGFGELEGTDSAHWEIDGFSRVLNTNEFGIEPVRDVLARAKKFLERVKAENSDEAKILMVGHGTLLKMLHYNIVGYDDETDFREFYMENGEIVEYDI